MRILFLNQYFPPDPAPTGILFREIADELARRGHEVDFVDAGESSPSKQKRRPSVSKARRFRPGVIAVSSNTAVRWVGGFVPAGSRITSRTFL